MSDFQLCVVCSDHRLPSQLVNCEKNWKAIDLKQHLSKIFPGEPPVKSQRLVFAGQLITDDSDLFNVIGQDSVSRTVHLVLSPSFTSRINIPRPAPSNIPDKKMSDAELNDLQKQYLEYLQDYYSKQIASIYSTASGFSGQIPMIPWSYMPPTQLPANLTSVQQEAAPVVEEEPQPRGRFRRWLLMLNGNNEPADQAAADQVAAPDGGFDIVDFVYAALRFVLVISLCVSYSSWQRISLVFLVAAYFYWRNGDRRNAQLPFLRLQQQAQPPPNEPNENAANEPQQPPAPETESSAERQQPTSETNTATTSTPETGTDAAAESVSTEDEQPAAVDGQPTNKIADAIKNVTLASFRLVVAIFTSLVPEVPVDLAGDA